MTNCHVTRSIKQLKREIKATLQAKAEERQKSIKGLEPEDENQEAPYNKVRDARTMNSKLGATVQVQLIT